MTRHLNPAKALAALLLMSAPPAALAVDGIVLEVRELTVAGMAVEGASVRLDVLSETHTRLTVGASAANLPEPAGKLTSLRLVCDAPAIAEPRFACDAGRLSGRGGPTGAFDMKFGAEMRTDTGVVAFSGSGFAVAGTTASFDGRLDDKGWQVKATSGTTTVAALRKFAEPWFTLPADISGDGKVTLRGAARDAGAGIVVDGTMQLAEVSLSNEASTVVSDGLAATARLSATLTDKDTAIQLGVAGEKGQVLVGPVLLDFGKNPLTLLTQGVFAADVLTVQVLNYLQKDLAQIQGTGRVNLAGETPLISGEFQIANLEFPAAYTSFMQITLATSLLGDLATSGTLRGELAVHDNDITLLHLVPQGLELRDNKGRMFMTNVNGDIHWSPVGTVDAQLSKLSWSAGGAYGLSGGEAEMEFVALGTNFALTRPTKLPVFDGAIVMETFAMANLGADNMEVAFRGGIEPISMPLLAKAFDWPEFSGTLAASIPGVQLKDNVLTFQGNVESQVFGGQIVGSNIRLQDPLGNFPQFFADVRARDLDLGLVTQTFEVGSITGKLEVDVLGLELFDWSPVAFDARLATPKGDKSRRRISAKAVSSLSNVGGGGGGVVNALQSGVLKFFDDYSYEKLGINCRLRGDICEMSGIEPAGIGYYIVKGAGLPRIDIVGNAGRVRWSQLVDSVLNTTFGDATVQ